MECRKWKAAMGAVQSQIKASWAGVECVAANTQLINAISHPANTAAYSTVANPPEVACSAMRCKWGCSSVETTGVRASTQPKTSAPTRLPMRSSAHIRSSFMNVSRLRCSRSGTTGSSVFSVKSSLRAMTTKMKPSGYAADAAACRCSAETILAANALARKLNPMTMPEAREDQSSEAAGRSISFLAGSRMLSWISTALRRVPDSGFCSAIRFLPSFRSFPSFLTFPSSKAGPYGIGEVQPFPGNSPGTMGPGEPEGLQRGELGRNAEQSGSQAQLTQDDFSHHVVVAFGEDPHVLDPSHRPPCRSPDHSAENLLQPDLPSRRNHDPG